MKFKMESIAKLGKMGLAAMNRNLPSILSGAAIAGIVATVWTTYKAAPEINSALEGARWDKIEEEDKQDLTPNDVSLTAWETFKAVAPYVWKPAACVVFSAGCVIAANVLNVQRLTMLAGAYKLSEKKLHEYEEKAKELLGEKKSTELRDEVNKAMCDCRYDPETVEKTGNGKALFYDQFSGRYFRSSAEAIRKAEADINRELAGRDNGRNCVICNEFVSLNRFYESLGLNETKFGNDFGWGNTGNTATASLELDLTYEVQFIDGEQTPVGILDYEAGLDCDVYGDYFPRSMR